MSDADAAGAIKTGATKSRRSAFIALFVLVSLSIIILTATIASAINGNNIVSEVVKFLVDQSPPEVVSDANFTLIEAFTNNTMRCTIVANDSLTSPVQANITYYVNSVGVLESSSAATLTDNVEYTGFDLLDGATYFEKGDNVSCNITLWDTVNNTIDNATDFIAISNYPPNQVNLTLPENEDEFYINRTPIFNWTNTSDIDSADVLRYELEIDTNNNFDDGVFFSIVDLEDTTYYYNESELALDLTYWWRVRANDSDNVSEWSDVFNFTIRSSPSLTLLNNSIDFGLMGLNDINDTESSENYPIVAENTGNIEINVSVNATSLWLSTLAPLDTGYYQFKANRSIWSDDSFDNHTFTWDESQTEYANMSSDIKLLYAKLNHTDGEDIATMDIRVTVPGDEYPGSHEPSTIFFYLDEVV